MPGKPRHFLLIFLATLLFLIAALPARADTGVGILVVMGELMYGAQGTVSRASHGLILVAVIFIETIVVIILLRVAPWRALLAMFVANIASTLLGIVLAYCYDRLDWLSRWSDTFHFIITMIALCILVDLSITAIWSMSRRGSSMPLWTAGVILSLVFVAPVFLTILLGWQHVFHLRTSWQDFPYLLFIPLQLFSFLHQLITDGILPLMAFMMPNLGLSIWLEGEIANRMLPRYRLWTAMVCANIASYVLMAVYIVHSRILNAYHWP